MSNLDFENSQTRQENSLIDSTDYLVEEIINIESKAKFNEFNRVVDEGLFTFIQVSIFNLLT